MPIIKKIEDDLSIELAIWENVESDAYFLSKIEIHESEKSIIRDLKNRKRSEWLSSRYLLHIMSGRAERGHFIKDVHGKPHLQDSDYHVSISHSKNFVAVIASESLVGIDIQTYVKKITRIRHKFVTEIESEMFDEAQEIKALHIIWGAKESLYKAYGLRGLDFKKHIFIHDLSVDGDSGKFKGTIEKENYRKDFDLWFHNYNQYVLVYAKES